MSLCCIYHAFLPMQVMEEDDAKHLIESGVWFPHPNDVIKNNLIKDNVIKTDSVKKECEYEEPIRREPRKGSKNSERSTRKNGS
jgi:hypothetical protein